MKKFYGGCFIAGVLGMTFVTLFPIKGFRWIFIALMTIFGLFCAYIKNRGTDKATKSLIDFIGLTSVMTASFMAAYTIFSDLL